MITIYHRDVYLPETILKGIPEIRICPKYTDHAFDQAEKNTYEVIVLPTVLTLYHEYLFEVTVSGDKEVEKIAYRLPYSEEFDLCITYVPHNNLVLTVWLNEVNDNHPTLKKERYAQCI